MHPENLIWQLISRSLNGEASVEEIHSLEKILNEDEALQQRYDILKQFWHSSDSLKECAEENKDSIARILAKANEADTTNGISIVQKRRSRLKKTMRFSFAVAALMITSGIIFFIAEKQNGLPPVPATQSLPGQQLVAQKGTRNRTILPDGSVVCLNAGSTLSYAGDFKSAREVYLKGEAFFDVVKQEHHPFIVHANGIDIKVLGTAFDIKSYSEEATVEATLIRGLIQITRQGAGSQKPVYLHPHEKLVITLSKSTVPGKEKEIVATDPVFRLYHLDSTVKKEELVETSWIYNRLEFRGDHFEELSKKLERWYNIKIIFADEASKYLSFNGSFENETVEQAFAALQAAVPFNYSIHDQEVIIKSISAN